MITIKSATYKTKLSPEQFVNELNKVMDESSFYQSYLSSNIFSGKFNPKKNEFVFWKNYRVRRNVNRPTIYLRVFKDIDRNGSEIKVKYGFNNQFEIFGIVVLSIWFAGLITIFIQKNDIFLILPLIFTWLFCALFVFVIGLLFFFFEFKSTKKSLEDLLNI